MKIRIFCIYRLKETAYVTGMLTVTLKSSAEDPKRFVTIVTIAFCICIHLRW